MFFCYVYIEKVLLFRNSTKRTAPVGTNCLSLNASVQTENLLNTPLNQERVTFGHFSQPQYIRYSSDFWQSYWTANVTRYCLLTIAVKWVSIRFISNCLQAWLSLHKYTSNQHYEISHHGGVVFCWDRTIPNIIYIELEQHNRSNTYIWTAHQLWSLHSFMCRSKLVTFSRRIGSNFKCSLCFMSTKIRFHAVTMYLCLKDIFIMFEYTGSVVLSIDYSEYHATNIGIISFWGVLGIQRMTWGAQSLVELKWTWPVEILDHQLKVFN